MSIFKCRRCRCVLFSEECVLTSHGEPLCGESQKTANLTSESLTGRTCDQTSTLWFISIGCVCPDWLSRCLSKGQWTKGKLLCPKCRGRLGSFDFTSHQNCHCGQFASPPVHVNRNRVDLASDKFLKKESAAKSVKNYGKLFTSLQSVSSCDNTSVKLNVPKVIPVNSEKHTTSSKKLLKNGKASEMASEFQTLLATSTQTTSGQLPTLAKTTDECAIQGMPLLLNSETKHNFAEADNKEGTSGQHVTSDLCNSFGNMSSQAKRNSKTANQNTGRFSGETTLTNSVISPSPTVNADNNPLDYFHVNAREISPPELNILPTTNSDSAPDRTVLNNHVRQSSINNPHNSVIGINNIDQQSISRNVSTNSGGNFEASGKRHKRVISDCSWLQHRDKNAFTTQGSPLNSASSSRANSSEDVHTRNHGSSSRPLPLSTALLRKRYGHRRAISMTATSNRFEFLQEDTDMKTSDYSERKKVYRQVSTEIAEPSIPAELTCPVCLDLLCNPHGCLPCQHTFCESCLRQLARTQPDKTSCPMCRQLIVRCQPQHHLSFLLKGDYPMLYSRRRKATRKPPGKLHPLPQLKADLRHKLGVVMQSRLHGRRLQEICRDHFIMTFFVYTGAVALLLGVFLLLILVCCKSLFFLFLLIQWMLFGLLRFGTSAAEVALTLSPSLIATTTEATLANRVILTLIGLGLFYKVWFGTMFRERGHQQHTLWRY